MAKKKDRDIEKGYSVKQMVAKLRRLADCLEKRETIQNSDSRRENSNTGQRDIQY